MEHTRNYGLNQYEPQDPFKRTDFNEDNARIDAALTEMDAAKCEVVFGSYTGNDADSRTISLGFYPRAVLLETFYGERHSFGFQNYAGGLALRDRPVLDGDPTSVNGLELIADGFVVRSGKHTRNNKSGNTYYYIAFK